MHLHDCFSADVGDVRLSGFTRDEEARKSSEDELIAKKVICSREIVLIFSLD